MDRRSPATVVWLVGPDRDLDLIPVRVLEKSRVGAGAVGAPFAWLGNADAAGVHALFPGRLDGDDAEAGEAEQSEARPGLVVRRDEEDRFGDAPANGFVLLEVTPPAKGREQRVVERRAPLEVGYLQ